MSKEDKILEILHSENSESNKIRIAWEESKKELLGKLNNRFELICLSKNMTVGERLNLWMQFDIWGEEKVLKKLYEKL